MGLLTAQKYVEFVLWAKELLKSESSLLPPRWHQFLLAVDRKDYPAALEHLKNIAYTTLEEKKLFDLLQVFEANGGDIQRQWAFSSKFDPDADKVNVILDKDILIFQEAPPSPQRGSKLAGQSIKTWESLKQLQRSGPVLLYAGQPYQPYGLSSIDTIYGVLRESQIQEEMDKYQKYEKIAKFIENLDYPLQSLFSLNQIGVIIYQSRIYLIKWVQFINENQLLGEKQVTESAVTVLEDLGVKIGVELKDDLELGDLVVFKNQENADVSAAPTANASAQILEPLLSLEGSLFATTLSDSKPNYKGLDFSKPEDCQIFVNDVLGRIESGILLLNQNKLTSVKNSRDMDIYIKISMETLANLKSINQRINILRDLLGINTNPDNLPVIMAKLEENYLLFIKEQFILENTSNIPFVLKNISRLHLFSKDPGILVNTLVYLFDSYNAPSKIILESVELIYSRWELAEGQIHMLERPQIIAITNIVIHMLSKGNFSGVIDYLAKYLEGHPLFRSQNVISLLLQILVDLFHQRHVAETEAISNTGYIRFFGNVVNVLNDYIAQTVEPSPDLIGSVTDTLVDLSKNLDFIAFINNQMIEYLALLNAVDQTYITPRTFYKVLSNFCQTGPVICFHKRITPIAFQIFDYLTQYYKNTDLTTEYMVEFVAMLTSVTRAKEPLPQDFLNRAVQLIFQFDQWLHHAKVHRIALKPLERAMAALVGQWYVDRMLPELPIATHKQFIDTWLSFVGLEARASEFLHLLQVKDLIWECERGEIKPVYKKYHLLPPAIFLESAEVLYLEINGFLDQISHDFNEFRVYNFLFNAVQKDYAKLHATPMRFKLVLKKYIANLRQLLERSILGGFSASFKEIITEVFDNLMFLPRSFFKSLYKHFIVVHEFDMDEGKRFNSRIEMMQATSLTLEDLLRQYESIRQFKAAIFEIGVERLSREFITQYVAKLKDGAVEIFARMQSWLIQICATEYIQNLEKLQPVKTLIENVLLQFQYDQQRILGDLQALCDEIFSNQKMLIDNKKKFFKMMLEIVQKQKYPDFFKDLREKFNYIKELSNIEGLYYTIGLHDKQKTNTIQRLLKKVFNKYSNLFTPWFIYGNTYALQEDYPEAIAAYEKALEFQSNQSNFIRLYHNLIVAYLSQDEVDKAVKVINSLDIGIKTDLLMVKLIRRVEEITGNSLLPVV